MVITNVEGSTMYYKTGPVSHPSWCVVDLCEASALYERHAAEPTRITLTEDDAEVTICLVQTIDKDDETGQAQCDQHGVLLTITRDSEECTVLLSGTDVTRLKESLESLSLVINRLAGPDGHRNRVGTI